MPLRRPAIGLAVLSAFVLGAGTLTTMRYGVGGAPAVVALAILAAYGGPVVQSAWLVVTTTPIVAVLATQLGSPSPDLVRT